jgi:diketogulonate reductase-like aldo/keto reductase
MAGVGGTQRTAIPTVRLPTGEPIPVLGQGTHGDTPDSAHRRREIAALRAGLDLGLTLIDAVAGAEPLVGEAIVRRRDDVFLVARLPAHQATRRGMVAACAASARRLGTEMLDLYLLQGRGPIPLEETIQGFEALREAGMIRHWGVAGFSLPALAELYIVTANCAAAEVRYDLERRAAEWDLLDRCRERGLPVLASTPMELRGHPRLAELAARHEATPSQVALAWLLSHEGLVAITPSEHPEQVAEHRAAVELQLDGHDHAMLDEAFPPPLGPQPLE